MSTATATHHERDDFQGPPNIANPPRQKKLYLFDLNERCVHADSQKRLISICWTSRPADSWPARRHSGRHVQLPVASVESVTPVDDFTFLVGLDNTSRRKRRVAGTRTAPEIYTSTRRSLRTLRVQPCKTPSTGARNGHDDRGRRRLQMTANPRQMG